MRTEYLKKLSCGHREVTKRLLQSQRQIAAPLARNDSLWNKLFEISSTRAQMAGVTFLEVVVVMVMLSIMATIAIPRLQPGIDNRKAQLAQQSLGTLADGLRFYCMEYANTGVTAITSANFLSQLDTKGFVRSAQLEKGFCYELVGSPCQMSAGTTATLRAKYPSKTLNCTGTTYQRTETYTMQGGGRANEQ